MELRGATILFADLRGFSAMAASQPPAVVFEMVDRWLARMSEIVAATRGAIAGFMGDAILAVFDDPRQALVCAVDMQIAMDAMNRAKRAAELPDLYLGVGLHSGRVIAGVVGSALYSARTVLGEDVNLAARIEAFGLRGQILASQATCALYAGFADMGEPLEVFVKGHAGSIVLREVRGIPSLGKRLPRQERRRSPRVRVHIPLTYQLLANDMVSQVRARGTVLDLGYRGMQVELDRELGMFEELKLELELPYSGYRVTDLYGRIVNAKAHAGHWRFGVEFTAFGDETGRAIRRLVHLLIQGTGSDER